MDRVAIAEGQPMRNPLFMFLMGLLTVVAIAFASVHFEVMTTNELTEKMKTLLILFVPITIFGVIFAYDHFKKSKK